ncbi:MAG: serine acetyltransferase [Elusimicrobia bacterium]|nr:serine acetyltransferase [Elusimicrobiota bacterium]
MMTAREIERIVQKVAEDLGKSLGDGDPLGRKRSEEPLPSRPRIIEAVEAVRSALFPGYFDAQGCSAGTAVFHVGAALDGAQRVFREQIRRALCFSCGGGMPYEKCRARARELTADFLKTLPRVRRLLLADVQAAYEGDPAATSHAETIFCYPGVFAIIFQRIAHELYRLKVPLIPRIITEHAHSLTGIDIHPGAAIGPRFFIDHGTGVVIGETTTIGRNVRLYQGVTLGAKSFPLDKYGRPVKGIKRHPDVDDDVIVYAGATILGAIRIGKGSTIGGNVWVTEPVPPGSKVLQAGPAPRVGGSPSGGQRRFKKNDAQR